MVHSVSSASEFTATPLTAFFYGSLSTVSDPCHAPAPARSRRLSVRNCPQAARISDPRGVRIGAANPAAITIPANRSSAAFPLGSYLDPGQGLNGIK